MASKRGGGLNQSSSCIIFCYCLFLIFTYVSGESKIYGFYAVDSHGYIAEGGQLHVISGRTARIRVVGQDLNNNISLTFTRSNSSCNEGRTKPFDLVNILPDGTSAVSEIEPDALYQSSTLYACVAVKNAQGFIINSHQGVMTWVTVHVDPDLNEDPYLLPLWLQIIICLVLLVLSGLFSGLNLGLMSLDQTELKIIEKVGSDSEKKHARRISPLRKRGNLLLCTLLLGNVMVNSTFTILFDNLTNGLIAVVCSTIGIVVFGEIIPQAICSRHGLAVGAKTYWITKFFMVITFPASFPISLILDKILGEEMGQVYNKEKLQELIRMTADRRVLHDNEANIISGALQLTNKSVEDVMTKIEDVYMLEVNTVLDFETMTEIMHHGYTRVPVFDGEKTNIVNLLNTKDLALIDPDDKTLLSTVCKFYDHKPLYVDFDVKLDAMLQEFLHGNSHMAIVQKLHNNEDQDPYFENVGVITLEDVIEEILQSEIVDETDLLTDNRQKEVRARKKQDYGLFVPEEQRSKLPKQLAFVAFQFLTTMEPFSDTFLARNVLKNLMKKDIVVNLSPSDPVSKKNFIYQKGVPSDKFVLILQGTVEVTIGEEGMVFETGPFSYFGVECINGLRKQSYAKDDVKMKDYIPDFSVRAVTDVQYLCIHKSHYLAALRTTRMLRNSGSLAVNDAFDLEYEKVTKSNTNRNSWFGNHSPPPNNTPLEALRFDETGKKKSTSSLDRLTFFHRKPDPLDSLYRMRRTGSDAKDRSAEFFSEMDSPEKKNPVVDFKPKALPGDGDGKKQLKSPADKKKQTHTPFSSHSIHTLDYLAENDNDGDEDTKKIVPSPGQASLPTVSGGTTDEIKEPGSDRNAAPTGSYSEGTSNDKQPFVTTKPSPSISKNNTGSKGNSMNSKEAERVPLMNQTESGDDLNSPDATTS